MNHKIYLEENSRPEIVVRSEVDKFRSFLSDVVSFEPDFILSEPRPRLHYYDQDAATMYFHDLTQQTSQRVMITNASVLPRDFNTILVLNKVFLIGGEKKENEIRNVLADDCYILNEKTLQVEQKASMKNGRSGH